MIKKLSIIILVVLMVLCVFVVFLKSKKYTNVVDFSKYKIHPLTYSGLSPGAGPDSYEAVCYFIDKNEKREWSKNRDDMQVFYVDSDEANLKEEWKYILKTLNSKLPFNPQITLSEFKYEENNTGLAIFVVGNYENWMKLTDKEKYDYLHEFNLTLDKLVYGYRSNDVHLKYTSLFYKCDGLQQKWIGSADNTGEKTQVFFDWTNKPEYM